MQDGVGCLPTICVLEKNETMRIGGRKVAHFRLLATAPSGLDVVSSASGEAATLAILPAISPPFQVGEGCRVLRVCVCGGGGGGRGGGGAG